jgi:ABC-type Na+ efflux pump permease subunit
VWKHEVDEELRTTITSAIGGIERQAAIAELGLTEAEAERLLQPPELASSSLEPTTREETARADLGRVGVVLLFLMIAVCGGFVLTGVVEEKSSRVVEVLLSRVRPAELLAGKHGGLARIAVSADGTDGGDRPDRPRRHPLWQIAAAIAIMAITVTGLVRLAARIYAGGVLRFGARVPLRDAWRGDEV